MNKRKIGKVLVILSLALAAKAEAISLESKAAIEEIRTRLNQAATVPTAAPEPEVKSNTYIPGQDLKNALMRLRSGMYGTAVEEKNLQLTAKGTANIDFVDNYQPGALLSRSLDKIRAQREIARMIKLINTVKTIPQFPPMVKTHAPTPKPEPDAVVEPAPSQELIEPANADVPLSEGESEKSEPAADNRKNSSGELLQEVRLKLNRKLTHEKVEAAEDKSEGAAKIPEAKKEEDDINNEISNFEFKMPANYRIIVR